MQFHKAQPMDLGAHRYLRLLLNSLADCYLWVVPVVCAGLQHRHSPCSYPKACGTFPLVPWSNVAVGLTSWRHSLCAFLGCIATMKVSHRLCDNEFTFTLQHITRRASTTPYTLPHLTTFHARAHSTIDSQGNTFEFQSFHTYYTDQRHLGFTIFLPRHNDTTLHLSLH